MFNKYELYQNITVFFRNLTVGGEVMLLDGFRHKDFGVGVFDSRSKYNNKSFQERIAENFEVEFYLDDGGITSINGKEYLLQKNHILFVRPGDVRLSSAHFKCFYLHMEVSDEKLLDYLACVPSFFAVASSKIYHNLFHQLIQLGQESNYESKILYFSKIIALLVNIQRDSCFYSGEGKESVIYRAERFMTENFTDKITLKEVAESVHLSPNYFHKLFSDITGITPHDFLMKKRINYAKELIITSEYDMMEIAMMSGFGSQAYFNYCFKKTTGFSPLKYRKIEFNKYKG